MIELPAFLNQGTAACTDEPDLFHSTTHADQTAATATCRTCPLRPACADYALTHPEERGTWGGLTAAERRHILDPNDPTWVDEQGRIRLPCGTLRALTSHLRYRETCSTCRAAQDARVEEQRRTRLAEEHAAGGTGRGAGIHRKIGEAVCDACLAAERAAWAARPLEQRTRKYRRRAQQSKTDAGPALALAS
ncbi:WhiB family transcriptional regulator [Streptomyces sp. NPDC090231]|uniref:WhiB family transcriptional regulator n=1 Tax=unclassified Streptomyces TaxID=2593676 RepID=UPI003800B77F